MFNVIIREMQIKTAMRYHFTSVKMAIIKNYKEFLGGPMIKIPHSHCQGPEFNPWSGN